MCVCVRVCVRAHMRVCVCVYVCVRNCMGIHIRVSNATVHVGSTGSHAVFVQ